ncbi:MAG: MBL fold metallo-hydrolase [Balneolaceae bacterium]|nr:MBL fold metallo-hydrolase [Balneolaceae bacterium]
MGALLNIPAEWFLVNLNKFVTFTASWEGSWIQTYVNDPFIFAIWVVAIFAIASWHIPTLRWKLAGLFLALVCIQQLYGIIQKFEAPKMEVTVFDVGQGDATLIKTPGNKHFFIDAGVWTPDYNSARYIIIPHLKAAGITKLDAVFLSHPHADHIGGIKELIEKVPIDTIYNSGYKYNSNLYADYLKLTSKKEIPVVPLRAGTKVNLDPSMRIFVYGPEQWHVGDEPNEHSLILELVYGETEFLFMGDAGMEQEERLLSAYPHLLDTDFLKVGHHGSKTSSSREFLSRASAQWSIISVAKSNRFRHPHVEAVQRLRQSDAKLRFTSLEKAMIFTSDGTSIRRKRW